MLIFYDVISILISSTNLLLIRIMDMATLYQSIEEDSCFIFSLISWIILSFISIISLAFLAYSLSFSVILFSVIIKVIFYVSNSSIYYLHYYLQIIPLKLYLIVKLSYFRLLNLRLHLFAFIVHLYFLSF